MELRPQLIEIVVPRDPIGAVIVLHGGARRGDNMMVSPAQLSVLRMVPIARRIARAGSGRLAVFRLLNSRRGWDTKHTPVDDAQWALARLQERFGQTMRTCLVGHSLGGRAALLSARHPAVVSAVALAPWVLPSDAPRAITGKEFLIVHGSEDRIASPSKAAQLADAMRAEAEVRFVLVKGARHAMLRRHGIFSGLAAQFAVGTLIGGPAMPQSFDRDEHLIRV